MFRIRRIHDDLLPVNAAAIAQVQAQLRVQFPDLRAGQVDALPDQLRDPMAYRFRTVVFVAERGHNVRGFAVIMHAPDLNFCFLEFISAAPGEGGRGVGGALYERLQDECREIGALGLTDQTPLARMYADARAARFYDGPDEVHRMVVSRRVLRAFEQGAVWDFADGGPR